MGMESYFVKLRPLQNLSLQQFKSLLSKKNQVANYKDDSIVNQLFIMRISEENDVVTEISLEGCLSWFEKSMERCFDIIESIHLAVVPIEVLRPDNVAIPTSREDFIIQLKDFYSSKYSHFKLRYKDIYLEVLPDKSFYDAVEKVNKKSFLGKLFGK